MNRFATGWFKRPEPKRNKIFYRMFCPDCKQFKRVTNTGAPCRDCGSKEITLAHNWPANLHALHGGAK